MACIVALASLPGVVLGEDVSAGSTSPAGVALSPALKAKSDPAVRAATTKLRTALKALEAVMLSKDGFISPAFKRFEVAELKAQGEAPLMLTAPELKRLHAAFRAVQGTPELYAYVKAKRAYLDALHQAQTPA